MVDQTHKGGAIILEDDSTDKSQNADGSITEGDNEDRNEDSGSDDSEEYGENVLYCEECDFNKDKSESSWFPGDACPKCREGYLSAD